MLNQRLDQLTEYPFRRLAQLLEGVTPRANTVPIAMSVGDPQHDPPPLLHEVLARHAAGWGRYPPMLGLPEFRGACADWLTRRYRLPPGFIDPDHQVLPCAGTREALFMIAELAAAECGRGNPPAVLMPNPFYQVYFGAAVMAGAEPVFLPATRQTGFLPNLDAIPTSVLQRTALMYLCSPSNPQGAVANLDYLKQAITLARRCGFVLAVDECYAEIYSDGVLPPGALEACAALGEGCDSVVVFHTLSKRSSAPGLRSGFIAGDRRIMAAFAKVIPYSAATMPLPVQFASAALWGDEAHVEAMRASYRAKFDVAERVFGGRLGFYRPDGGFFLWLDAGDGERAARLLWEQAAIRTLPGAYLARPDAAGRNPGQPYIRVALVHDLETTSRALRRVDEILG